MATAPPATALAHRWEASWLGRHPQRNLAWAAAILGLALRWATLVATGHLTGSWEYDDAVYFGTAVQLVHGLVPYRDFVLIQPPGVPLALTPVALLSFPFGTHTALEVARALVPLVSFANVLLLGRLLRHRSPLAVAAACLVLALFPDAILAASALLLEPFLNLFCLLGLLALFSGDRLTPRTDLTIWAGLAFGVGGTMKTWAVIPLAAVAVVMLLRGRVAQTIILALAAGIGFLLPCLPFVLLSPAPFIHQVFLDQLGRTGQAGQPILVRLEFMTSVWPGLGVPPGHRYQVLAAGAAGILLAVFAAAFAALPGEGNRRLPTQLEGFAIVSVLLVGVALCWPAEFFYHYASFLAPFLALLLGLAVARLERARPQLIAAVVALVFVGGLLHAAVIPALLQRAQDPSALLASTIPSGACVVTDESEYTLNADRFLARRGGCPVVVDALGTTISISGSQVPSSPQAQAAAPAWLGYFSRATYLLLTPLSGDRIPWNRQLESYVGRNFHPLLESPVLVLKRNPPVSAPLVLPLPPVPPGP